MEHGKQIEEMAKITCQMYCRDKDKKCAGVQECDMKCLHYQRCEVLYNAGYRKQSEGEWKPIIKCKTSTKTLIYYQCSLCGVYLASEANYCPNCGAKMKGGEG